MVEEETLKVYNADDNALITSFSSTKRQILIILKREGSADLTSLAKQLGVTKMGALNHLTTLEEMEVVERFKKKIGVGRPRTAFKLAPNSKDIFPKAYSSITCSVLQFVEEKMGRKAVYQALKHRQDEIKEEYMTELEHLPFEEKLKEFSKIRDKEGYMVELNMIPNSSGVEFLEYNCPILNVADRYSEACMVEQELFSELFDAIVETSHRTVAGDNLCRFFIKPKKK